MTTHWDRAGESIEDTLEWATLFEDPGYRLLALDVEGRHRVSTLWQGLDLAHGRLPRPQIFETAFLTDENGGYGDIIESFYWPDEETALVGHAMMCREFLHRDPRPGDGHLDAAIARLRRL